MKILDQFDYEVLGVKDAWYFETTLNMLTSFEMEIKGYLLREDSKDIYPKVYRKLKTYVTALMFQGDLQYVTPKEEYEEHFRDYGVYPEHIASELTCFDKNKLFECIEKDNRANIDICRLKRFLSGEEVPITSIAPKQISIHTPINPQCSPNPCSDGKDISDSKDSPMTEDNNSVQGKYHFIKKSQTWDIRFGDLTIDGLKHMTGLDYIKILLQNPNSEISVIDIQAMLNPAINYSSRAKISRDKLVDFNDDEDIQHSYSSEEPNANKTSRLDKTSNITEDHDDEDTDINDEYTGNDENLEKLKRGIAKLSAEDKEKVTMLFRQTVEQEAKLEGATERNETIEVSRLTTLVNMLKDDMYNILQKRTDDPELDKNRKKVYKNIKDARDNIKAEEIAKGYEHTPVYNYLTEHIITGYTCKYNPRVDETIKWIF